MARHPANGFALPSLGGSVSLAPNGGRYRGLGAAVAPCGVFPQALGGACFTKRVSAVELGETAPSRGTVRLRLPGLRSCVSSTKGVPGGRWGGRAASREEEPRCVYRAAEFQGQNSRWC